MIIHISYQSNKSIEMAMDLICLILSISLTGPVLFTNSTTAMCDLSIGIMVIIMLEVNSLVN